MKTCSDGKILTEVYLSGANFTIDLTGDIIFEMADGLVAFDADAVKTMPKSDAKLAMLMDLSGLRNRLSRVLDIALCY
jgi:hypothetical protein